MYCASILKKQNPTATKVKQTLSSVINASKLLPLSQLVGQTQQLNNGLTKCTRTASNFLKNSKEKGQPVISKFLQSATTEIQALNALVTNAETKFEIIQLYFSNGAKLKKMKSSEFFSLFSQFVMTLDKSFPKEEKAKKAKPTQHRKHKVGQKIGAGSQQDGPDGDTMKLIISSVRSGKVGLKKGKPRSEIKTTDNDNTPSWMKEMNKKKMNRSTAIS